MNQLLPHVILPALVCRAALRRAVQATIMPRGHALGMVSQVPDKDEYSTTKQQMLARMDVCMGGKAAEELIFGERQGGGPAGLLLGVLMCLNTWARGW